MPQSLATGNLRAPKSERGLDLYETPEVAVHALLRVEHIGFQVWEPACGSGHIVKVLRDRGHSVLATDIANHHCPESNAGIDFLTTIPPIQRIDAIITNPPFFLAEQFVKHALELGIPKICMLLRLAFLESERRRDLFARGQLARVHQFRKRLPMMHRAGWEGRRANSGMPFAWFVWEQHHRAPPAIHWVSWEKED